jgi:HAE1 family hydrophobic/amphiphilic exporter-1
MKNIFSSPFRVYLVMAMFAFVGIWCGLSLPVSLYPNSTKPTIYVGVSYGSLSAKEFLSLYGDRLEASLNAISTKTLEVEKMVSDYETTRVSYKVEFSWGTEPKEALKEVQTVLNGHSSGWPREIRDSASANFWSSSSGFIAISFYSEELELGELYKVLEPVLMPRLVKIQDAENPNLWNPSQKEISISLRPEAMANLGLFPRDIEAAVEQGLEGYVGGSVTVGTKQMSIQMPRKLRDVKELEDILVTLPNGQVVHLSEVAHIDLGEASESNNIFKTSGIKSLILFANPKAGANVKNMAEEVIRIVEEVTPTLAYKINYKKLVDPSEFIRASVKHVVFEVFLAAFIASFVLFLFIGSVRNTITATIEIPLSIILAFILMYLTDINLNLISLGGLALAAGMNIDASVVIMENIFRHFKDKNLGLLSYKEKLEIIYEAVSEVKLTVVASTISTLVVFAPLAMTQDLTNAVLGDLARAIVFSHGFSMFIAIVLVPTIRLHLVGRNKGKFEEPVSPIDKPLTKLENLYLYSLEKFVTTKKYKKVAFGSLGVIAVITIFVLFPRLERELIGTPDTDWMIVNVNTQGNSLVKQMEVVASETESRLLETVGDDISYTFTQIQRPNQATVMARIKDKKLMDKVWKKLETEFQNTPDQFFWIGPWNPAELPIPDPPDMRISVRGGSLEERSLLAFEVLRVFRESHTFGRVQSIPNVEHQEQISITPLFDRFSEIRKSGGRVTTFDISDISRVATTGRWLRSLAVGDENYPIKISYPRELVSTMEELMAFPIGVSGKIIPMKSIVNIKLSDAEKDLHRENSRDLVLIEGRHNKGDKVDKNKALKEASVLVENYLASDDYKNLSLKTGPQVLFEDAQIELSNALSQLTTSLLVAIALIFFVLLFQFGNLVHTLIIMVAIPTGVLGRPSVLFF